MIYRKRDFPRTLTIGDNEWEIRWVRRQRETGLCHTATHTITIRCGLSPRERFVTVVHEVIHAICHEYGIAHSESDVERLEEPIVCFLIDNGLTI